MRDEPMTKTTPQRAATRPRRASFLHLCALASLALISACAPRLIATDGAAPPQLTMPAWVETPCTVTANPVATLADLEARDRARGTDVGECDSKRAVAVQVHALQADIQAKFFKARAQRNGWFCRNLGLFCGG